jgi:hypothetical protein
LVKGLLLFAEVRIIMTSCSEKENGHKYNMDWVSNISTNGDDPVIDTEGFACQTTAAS